MTDIDLPEPVDILAFGPHPDDVELCAGGLMLKAGDAGYRLVVVDATRGEAGSRGTVEIRAKESAAASELLGLVARENLGFPDAGVFVTPEAVAAVTAAIRKWRPRVVLSPCTEDRHPDHVATAELIRRAYYSATIAKAPGGDLPPHRPDALIEYFGHLEPAPSFVVDISPYWERRMDSHAATRRSSGSTAPTAPRPTSHRPTSRGAWPRGSPTGARASGPTTASPSAWTASCPWTTPSRPSASVAGPCCERPQDRHRLLPDVRRVGGRGHGAGQGARRARPRDPPALLRAAGAPGSRSTRASTCTRWRSRRIRCSSTRRTTSPSRRAWPRSPRRRPSTSCTSTMRFPHTVAALHGEGHPRAAAVPGRDHAARHGHHGRRPGSVVPRASPATPCGTPTRSRACLGVPAARGPRRSSSLENGMTVIPNFVDSERFQPGGEARHPKRCFSQAGPRSVLMHVSNFRAVKRSDVGRWRPSRMSSRAMPATLVMVGDGPDRSARARRAPTSPRPAGSDVRFLGAQTDIEHLLPAAGRLPAPERVRELRARGPRGHGVRRRARSSTRAGGLPEVIRDGEDGILVDPEAEIGRHGRDRRPTLLADRGDAWSA